MEVIKCAAYQGWINILQSLPAFKHNIGSVLALIHAPVVSLVESFFNRIKIRVHFMCKEVKLSAQAFGIKPVGKFLCLCNVADLEKELSYIW